MADQDSVTGNPSFEDGCEFAWHFQEWSLATKV